ncbi:hypothetical protein GK047_05775 [Paenibacillus sp. SYP-B3998]|uniref:Flagellar hook-length control protein FliK n=1 Tax=Paenibacillus sp. SYP-B3998 TaxID=2678564 RepID=A0A6G3ZTI5_9BACL|nr:hypothetical protein [Paenibacillus sp. SYP-B3998]NEW05526.1 hypothetical protein [Paenibacillus sp. SYP-B3998]
MTRLNISGLIRGLVGELTASESKVLELKVGQIVKGVVLQLLSDQDALINIGGVQVRAKLETPLKQGDVTMLQVQPESNNGQIMLKPLMASDVLIADESFNELLKAFSLKDTASNRQMLQTMQQAGVPISKENVESFASLLSKVPEGSKEEWAQAAVLAFKKDLPLTQATVSAIRQATTGPAVGQLLQRLEQEASALLEAQPAHPEGDTMKQVVSLLKELRATAAATWPPRQPEAAATIPPAVSQAGGIKPTVAPTGAPLSAIPSGSAPAPAASVTPAVIAAAGEALTSAAPRAEAPAAGAAQPPVPTQATTIRPALAAELLKAQSLSAEPVVESEAPKVASPELTPSVAKPKAAESSETQQRSADLSKEGTDPEPNWISKMLKAVGVEHESHLAKLADDRVGATINPRSEMDDLQNAILRPDSQPDSDSIKPAADTLKSLLLQLTASDDTPAPLKEAAQQVINQITGQQLMLTGDKSSMFAHLTLFIPFMDGTGQQSASVHIQSRKGKRGEVDANNCRLLFDLQMKAMGNTLLDVHVVNKIVSLNVHNDHPAIAALMESSKEEITSAMQKVGYQFLSLKCSPYPTLPAVKDSDGAKQGQGILEGNRADLRSLYEPKPYKGVDFRA